MKRSLLAFALLPLLLAADAPSTKPTLLKASDKDALRDNQGKQVTVEGKVSEAAWSGTGKVMNIRFEGADDSGFVAVVFQKNKDAFDKAFGGDAAKALTGAVVDVSGKLATYKDKPQIILNKTDQLVIADASGPAATPPAKSEK
jgi:hypothetical protein